MSIAVIGAGYRGKKAIREILDLSAATGLVELHSVVDTSPSTLEQCRDEFGDIDSSLDTRALLLEPGPSAVHICTPNYTHYELASSFLRNGKSVLVEMPLTIKLTNAYRLVQLANEKQTVLSTGHVHRFDNAVKELKKTLATGLLGALRYLKFRWTGPLQPQNERGVVTELAAHPFDISNYLLDQWPSKITCRGLHYRTEQNGVAFITAEYANDPIVNVEASSLDWENRNEIIAVCSEGTASLDCSDQKIVLTLPDQRKQLHVAPSNTMRQEILHFVDCVKRRSVVRSPAYVGDGVLGTRIVALLEASRKSMYGGCTRPVYFPPFEEVLAT